MDLIKIGDVSKWSWNKKLASLMCLVILIGVFLPWTVYTYEFGTETAMKISGTEYSAWGWFVLAILFSIFFILTGYEITAETDSGRIRVNELLACMLGFLVFIYSLQGLNRIRAAASRTGPLSVGSGIYLIVIGSFLFMVFSYLLWKENTGASQTVTLVE